MAYTRPQGVLAGFHAARPDPDVPELVHIGEQWAPRRFRITDHAHETWELYLQVVGETRWECGGDTHVLAPACLLAVPPGVRHHLCEPTPARHHFFFAAVDLDAILSRRPELAPPWPHVEVVRRANGEALLAPFRQLIREVSLDLPRRAVGMRLALDALVVEASRLRERPGGAGAAPLVAVHPAVRRVQELMEAEPGRSWRLAELARRAGLSPQHLSECFTRDIGLPPHRYLVRLRVERARELLARSDLSVTDIALELGFASSQHFATAFKAQTGRSAAQWRRAL